MSEAAVMHPAVEPAESPLTPESWGKLGMWVFLAGDAMSFGTLIVGYGLFRFASSNWPQPSEVLGINLTALMTFLLICSSVTMVFSLSAIKSGDMRGLRKYLLLTILGGILFLGLQAYEWTHLITARLPEFGYSFTSHIAIDSRELGQAWYVGFPGRRRHELWDAHCRVWSLSLCQF